MTDRQVTGETCLRRCEPSTTGEDSQPLGAPTTAAERGRRRRTWRGPASPALTPAAKSPDDQMTMRSPTPARTEECSDAGVPSTAWEWLDECAVRMPLPAHHRDVEDVRDLAVEVACRLAEAVIDGGVDSDPIDVDADGQPGPWSEIVVRLLRVGPTLALVRAESLNGNTRATWLITLRRRPLPG